MRRLLFLDIDGCLGSDGLKLGSLIPSNAEAEAIDRAPSTSFQNEKQARREDLLVALRSLERPLIARLNVLVERTRAEVIVHSSWRYTFTMDGMRWALKEVGYRGELADMVPHRLPGQKMSQYPSRGDYIRQWFKDANVEPADTDFVIVDDAERSQFERFLPNLVRVNSKVGLADRDVERACALLEPPV